MFVNGVKKLFLTGVGANVLTVEDPATPGMFVGEVPFNPCSSGKACSKSPRNITGAWSVGESSVNVFVPTVRENEVAGCRPVAAPVGVNSGAGPEVRGSMAPKNWFVSGVAAALTLVVRNERTGRDSSILVWRLNNFASTSLIWSEDTFVTCTRVL